MYGDHSMSTEMQQTLLIPQLEQRRKEVEQIKLEVETLTANLTVEQLSWSPTPDVWPIALCLDHLNRVGYAVLPLMESAIQELHRRGRRHGGPFRYNWLERLFLRMVGPNPPFRSPVPPLYEPHLEPEQVGEVIPRFLSLQESLVQCLIQANGYHLKAIKMTSPANRLLRGSLGVWLEGTILHERYHLMQVQAVRSHAMFPGGLE
jgi:hypothetical protein